MYTEGQIRTLVIAFVLSLVCFCGATAGTGVMVQGGSPVRVGTKLYFVYTDDSGLATYGVWVLYEISHEYENKLFEIRNHTDSDFVLWRMNGDGLPGMTDAETKQYFETVFGAGSLPNWDKKCYFVDIILPNHKGEYEYNGRALGSMQSDTRERLGQDRMFTIVAVDIDVDTDRSGSVDETEEEDDNEEAWSKEKGAAYLVNNDDDNDDDKPDMGEVSGGTAPTTGGVSKHVPVVTSVGLVDGANDVNDIAPLIIQSLGTLDGITAYLIFGSVSEAKAIHLFPEITPGALKIFGGTGTSTDVLELMNPGGDPYVSAAQDITFGVEGAVYAGWNLSAGDTYAEEFSGYVDVTLRVRSNVGWVLLGEDKVRLRAAPLVLAWNGQDVEQVYANHHIDNAVRTWISPIPVTEAHSASIWLQDYAEIGNTYLKAGEPRPSTYIPVVVDLDHNSDRDWPTYLREEEPVYGYWYCHNEGNGGNIEVSPPLPPDYPLGRIVRGDELYPEEFLAAQGVQVHSAGPIRVYTKWLSTSHLDEVICFVPKQPWEPGSGYKVLVPSPKVAIDILHKLVMTTAYSGGPFPCAQMVVGEMGTDEEIETEAQKVLIKEDGAPATTLANSVDSSQMTFTLASSAGFANRDLLRIEDEFVRVHLGGGSTTIVVLRAQLGSQAKSHDAGTTIRLVATTPESGIDPATPGASETISLAQPSNVVDGDLLRIEDEYLLVTGGGGTSSIEVERGKVGTVATAHSKWSYVYALTEVCRQNLIGVLPNPPYSGVTGPHQLLFEGADAIVTKLRTALDPQNPGSVEIVELPVLFCKTGPFQWDPYTSNVVNCLVVGDNTRGVWFKAIMADPKGPKAGSVDYFQQYILQATAGTVVPYFIDAWELHKRSGEVHCGSNARRIPIPGVDWWDSLSSSP